MKSFKEMTIVEEVSNKEPYRLVVLAQRPAKTKDNSTSSKLVFEYKLF